MKEKGEVKIFVSHAREDEPRARQLRQWLRQHYGVTVVLDGEVELTPDEEPWEPVQRHIKESDLVAFLVTPQSLSNSRSIIEVGMTAGLRKPIIWIQVGRVPLRPPVGFPDRETVFFDEFGDPETVDALLEPYRHPASA